MGNKTLFCDSYLRAYSVRDWSTAAGVLCEAKYEAIAKVRKARRQRSCRNAQKKKVKSETILPTPLLLYNSDGFNFNKCAFW